jgi:glycosyltransferase involved in cell wall biosynthesis
VSDTSSTVNVPEAAFCTILARNYLAHARVLCRSLREHNPDVPVYALVVDEPEGYFDPTKEDFVCLSLADLDLLDARSLAFRYGVVELCTAVKPRFLSRVLARGHRKLLYLDPDIRVYRTLDPLLALLDTAQAVLTPHLTERAEGGTEPGELDVLLFGVYNLGFLGLAAGPEVAAFLDWWWDRCREHCVIDPASGLFVDQRWMDLAPGMLDRVRVVREPGYNLARWNLSQRRLSGSAEAPLVNGEPLSFFHFSAFDPLRPTRFFWPADGGPRPTTEPLRSVALRYAEELKAAGWKESHRWPYGHGFFSDGHPIDVSVRALYRREPREGFGNPFDVEGAGSFRQWAIAPAQPKAELPLPLRLLNRWARIQASLPAGRLAVWGARVFGWLATRAARLPSDPGAGTGLPPLAAEILALRPDVREAFAGPGGIDRPGYVLWLATSGTREHHLKPEWCAQWASRVTEGRGVMPLLLAQYDSRPELRRRFPMAFVEEHDAAAFLAWIREHARDLDLRPDVMKAAHRLFADRPAQKIAAIYRSRPDVERAFPRALSDPGDAGFLSWLRYSGRLEYDIPEDWVLWFARARQQHVCLHGAKAHCPEEPRAPIEELEGEVDSLSECDLGATLIGHFRAESGMGELARSTARSLGTTGCPLDMILRDDAPQRQTDRSLFPFTTDQSRPFAILHLNASDPVTDHQRRWLEGRYAIGYCTWELEAPPRRWPESVRAFDEVWTLSRFSAAALSASCSLPVQVMWPALPEPATPESALREANLDSDAFTFLFVFDLFSQIERKNPLGLIEAFRRAFAKNDKVRLVIKAGGARERRTDFERLLAAAEGLPVTIVERPLSRLEVQALMRACDAYVSLHRSEGFGLTLAEAMSLGKPVVATYYSGNVEFMTPWNSFPVPCRLAELAEDRGVYPKGSVWAEPDLDAAAAILRAVVRDPDRAREAAARGQADVRRLLSVEACGRRMADRLRVIARLRRFPRTGRSDDASRDRPPL